MSWHWNPGQQSPKVIGTDTDRPATHNFLLTFHSNHGPISHRFRNKWRFQSKIANTPCILRPIWRGCTWNWVSTQWVKNYSDGPTRPNKKFYYIFSRVDTIHQRDRRTDTGRQRRPRLCIASRGNNQLSRTKCAMRLCKRNSVADLLNHAHPHVCYHAESGCSVLKDAGINKGESQNSGFAGIPLF